MHLNLFHVLQTYSEHSVDLDVGVPARGLHGEAYRGHVFWDELFVLQLLNLRFPELARAVLRYRHRRLDAARQAAHESGLRGAMYPWQSASDGREESQLLHLNPLSGRWLPDHSHLQRHVGSAVAYNIWQYYQATGDMDFLAGPGAEMLLEIARFWSSAAGYHPARDRWSIRGVLGPDEYHDAYPWAEGPGLDDNAYTNVLASWALTRALDTLRLLPGYRHDELVERLRLDAGELDRWREVSRRLYVPFHDGVLSQFDGYERLTELDWAAYRGRYTDLRRLDRILEAEGDTVNRYRVSKQADALMLWYLFSAREVRDLLRQLGYPARHELQRRTTAYYLRRTVHGSTLSSVVHAWVLTRSDRRASWRYFRDALVADLRDGQGGTTAEGIHLGAMAGAVDLLQRCYTGLEIREDALWLDPHLPSALGCLTLELRYRGHWGVLLAVDHGAVTVSLRDGPQDPVRIRLRGTTTSVAPGETRVLPL
ncbi:glycosyl hydrolase family 65 protein [Kitasatospora sp. NPDC005751]|uniref:glycosyl hydrolase family 65 protein n=1 Tax=Kitasatospora sp. NPDC005751 TaxID=3157064 RepID=UPI0033DBFF88